MDPSQNYIQILHNFMHLPLPKWYKFPSYQASRLALYSNNLIFIRSRLLSHITSHKLCKYWRCFFLNRWPQVFVHDFHGNFHTGLIWIRWRFIECLPDHNAKGKYVTLCGIDTLLDSFRCLYTSKNNFDNTLEILLEMVLEILSQHCSQRS
jgi:hypothetical protein